MKTDSWMMSIVLIVSTLVTISVQAGELTPPGAPGPTMHTLEEIYQQLLATQQQVASLEARVKASDIPEPPAGMVLIPAGDFVMGDALNEGFARESPLHTLTLNAFYIDSTEVTHEKWDEVHDWAVANGYSFLEVDRGGKDKNHPVHSVTWYDCVLWANARSEMEGLMACYTMGGEVCRTNAVAPLCDWLVNGYRLPTEAEWEKAARGGVANRRFPWSDTSQISHLRENYNAGTGIGGWIYDDSAGESFHPAYSNESEPYTNPVNDFAPNDYGLYGMAGNLMEWCWDRFDATYYASSPNRDPRGPATGAIRIVRGGNWSYPCVFCRVASRIGVQPDTGVNYLGFRLVRAAR